LIEVDHGDMKALVLAPQNALGYQHLGVATSGVALFRSIGGSVGVAISGAILAAALASRLEGLGGGLSSALAPAGIKMPSVETIYIKRLHRRWDIPNRDHRIGDSLPSDIACERGLAPAPGPFRGCRVSAGKCLDTRARSVNWSASYSNSSGGKQIVCVDGHRPQRGTGIRAKRALVVLERWMSRRGGNGRSTSCLNTYYQGTGPSKGPRRDCAV
jgi:hypothetical protein